MSGINDSDEMYCQMLMQLGSGKGIYVYIKYGICYMVPHQPRLWDYVLSSALISLVLPSLTLSYTPSPIPVHIMIITDSLS